MSILDAEQRRVADELGRLLQAEGAGICTMPRMFGVLMHRACPSETSSVAALEAVLAAGVVDAMRDRRCTPERVPELADELIASRKLSVDQARWAIETWWRALQALEGETNRPSDWTAWNTLQPKSGDANALARRSLWRLGLAGVAGAIGGATWGLDRLLRCEETMLASVRIALEGLDGWLGPVALLTLGSLSGLAGAVFGWIIGGRAGGEVPTGPSNGRFVAAALTTHLGAAFGGLLGLTAANLAVFSVGAFLGACVGAVVGAWIVERGPKWWG